MTDNSEPAKVDHCTLHRDGDIPNNPVLPLLLYRQAVALPAGDPASIFETLFSRHGWPGGWRNGVFAFHHYHSTAHEVLGVFAGSATVQFGGDGGECFDVGPGDVIIIPAGVAHKNIRDDSLGVVGAYPNGQRPDMCRSKAQTGADAADTTEMDSMQKRVSAVSLPSMDPVYGADGPLLTHWR